MLENIDSKKKLLVYSCIIFFISIVLMGFSGTSVIEAKGGAQKLIKVTCSRRYCKEVARNAWLACNKCEHESRKGLKNPINCGYCKYQSIKCNYCGKICNSWRN